MKKLLIVFSALSIFFAACNNDKAGRKEETKSTNKEESRDDKSNNDDGKNDDAKEDNSSKSDNNNNSSREDNSSNRGWSASEINQFVTSCAGEAQKGMSRAAAERYCECMQKEIEKMYPVANDAANIDMESAQVQQMVKDCLY